MTATVEQVTVVLPLPRELLPRNRSGAHWAPHAKAARDWRETAGWEFLREVFVTEEYIPRWPAAQLDIEWRCAGTPPDDDNIIAAVKPLRDGIADTGIVADDRHVITGEVRVVRVRRNEEGLVLALIREEAR